MSHTHRQITRRRFLSTAAAAASATIVAPALTTANKSGSQIIIGHGRYRYQVEHNWPQLPARFSWQTTHNVAVDGAGQLYVIHEGHADKPDHPSIFVFDAQGKYIRSFGQQFQGGGHGIEVREEGGEEFLYICAYQQVKAIAKLTLRGEVVWTRHAPMDAGIYAEGEATNPEKIWGRDRFMPTNTSFLPGGDLMVADGYGSYYLHRYDKDGNWLSCLGGPGEGKGKFNTPHGIWYVQRPHRSDALVVADRAHNTLQFLTPEGRHQQTIDGFGLPANIDSFKDLILIPELLGRVTVLDGEDQVAVQLGDDSQRIAADKKRAIRRDPKQWQDGKFVHPHDACFDRHGNIFVAEWVSTGRVTKLTRLPV